MLVARRPVGPEWKPVIGARVLFAPIDRAMLRRARRAALASLGRDEHEGGDQADATEQLEELGDALSMALIIAGALDWADVQLQLFDDENVPLLDAAGEPRFEALPFSAENLAMVLADPITFDAFDTAYVVPFAGRERAKNGSAASPNGTGEAATPAADTASCPAAQLSAAGAPPAPTAPKPSRTKKPRASGRS